MALKYTPELDRGIQRHDLDLLHIQSRHRGEIRHSLLKQAGALVGVRHNVGLDKAELRVVGLQGLDIGLGAAGRDGRHLGAGRLGDLLRHDAAEGVIGALVAACGEGQFLLGGAAGAQSQRHAQNQDKRQCLFHLSSPPLFAEAR